MLKNASRLAAAALSVVALAATLTVSAASADAATATYKLQYNRMPDGTTALVRWNGCQTITYKVNLASVPTKYRKTFLAETHTAVAALAARTGFTFTYRGTTSELPTPTSLPNQSAELVIAYTSAAKSTYSLAGTIAGQGGYQSMWWSDNTSWQVAITRGFVLIDTPDVLRYFKAGFGAGQRRGNLLEHELGHAVGLGHVSDRRQLMYPSTSSSTPNGFYTGDRAGLAKVGIRAGCITIPKNVAIDFT